jgi:hypothetical protein
MGRESRITRWLYVWRPLLLSVGTAALILWAVGYGWAVHRAVRDELAGERREVARLKGELTTWKTDDGVSVANITVPGRLLFVPAGR